MSETVGAHVHQFGGEVGVHGAGGGVEGDGDGAGQFQVGGQGFRSEGQHVRAVCDRPLVKDAVVDHQGVAAPGWRRVIGVVDEPVGGFVRFGGNGGQRAVAVAGVGRAAGMEVPAGVLGAGQGPFLLVAPTVVAHHEQAHGGLVHNARGRAFEPVVVPAQQAVVQLDSRCGAEVDVAGAAGGWFGVGAQVGPGADE